MSKKEQKISINKFESTMNKEIITIPLVENGGLDVTIKRSLSLDEVLQFVEEVVSSCVNLESGEYTPHIQEFVIKTSTISLYTNISLPSRIDKQYDLIYNTDIVERVKNVINQEQYCEILDAIERKIDHKLNIIYNSLEHKLREMTDKMEQFIAASDQLFSKVNADDISTLMLNLSKADSIDEEKLVRAVFETQKIDQAVSTSDNVISFPKPGID